MTNGEAGRTGTDVRERLATITLGEARRITLTAQGFGDPRPAVANLRALRRVVGRTRLLQLDSVNIVARAHYLPAFSRLGGYPTARLDAMAGPDPGADLVEYWAHEAALLPTSDLPLFQWRMREFRDGRWQREAAERAAHLRPEIRAVLRGFGPSVTSEIEAELGHVREAGGGAGGWWSRSDVKVVCEAMFAAGELTAHRRRSFARVYDLPERSLPAEVLAADVPAEHAWLELVDRATAALGIGTAGDIADYYRMRGAEAAPAIDRLVAEGVLEPVLVRTAADRSGRGGEGVLAYRRVDAPAGRRAAGVSALLCPFDPLVFRRPRIEWLFDFDYRIEIYTPAAKRRYGYYVFPYLLDGRLAARVDLKRDTASDVLRVFGAFAELGEPHGPLAERLAADLRTVAEWLGVGGVDVRDNGDLAPALAAAI